jgi:hypothetical protein
MDGVSSSEASSSSQASSAASTTSEASETSATSSSPDTVGGLSKSEGVRVEVKADDTQESVLNRAYGAMADKAQLTASGKAAFVRQSDQGDNYSNHLMQNGKAMSDRDFNAIKAAGAVVVRPAPTHMQSLANYVREDAPKTTAVSRAPTQMQTQPQNTGFLGSIYDSAKSVYDGGVSAKNWVGSQIEGGVKNAEKGVDGFRKDIVQFGRDHAGFVGDVITRPVANAIGLAEGATLAVYDMGSGLVKLADNAAALANPAEWAFHADRNIGRIETTGKVAEKIGNLTSPVAWAVKPQENISTAKGLWNGVTKGYQEAAKDGDAAKFAGRFVVDAGSFLIGAGEANAAMKSSEAANAVAHATETITVAKGVDKGAEIAKGTDVVKGAEVTKAAETGNDAATVAKAAKPTKLSELPKQLDAARLVRNAEGLISHIDGKTVNQFANELVNSRADEMRQLRQAGVDGFSNKQTGPVVSIVVDRKTGAIFEGTNTQITNTAQLDSLLKKQLGDLDVRAAEHGPYSYGDKGVGSHPHPSAPGTHAEVSAVDQAIKARRAASENVTWADMKKELYYDNAFLDKGATRPAPTCANCTSILDGIPTDVGHFNQFPPKP